MTTKPPAMQIELERLVRRVLETAVHSGHSDSDVVVVWDLTFEIENCVWDVEYLALKLGQSKTFSLIEIGKSGNYTHVVIQSLNLNWKNALEEFKGTVVRVNDMVHQSGVKTCRCGVYARGACPYCTPEK